MNLYSRHENEMSTGQKNKINSIIELAANTKLNEIKSLHNTQIKEMSLNKHKRSKSDSQPNIQDIIMSYNSPIKPIQ